MTKSRGRTLFLITLIAFGGLACGGDHSDHSAQNEASQAAFCEEHQIAEAQCPYCNPELIESLGHCNGHGVPEAFCYQCNPALIPAFKAVGDWCAGHDRPESQCYICNPELDPFRKEAPASESSSTTRPLQDPSDPESLRSGSIARTQIPPSTYCSTQSLIVRFDSPDIASDAGLQFASVEARPITKTVSCHAEVAYDGNRYAQLSAQVPGVIAEVHADLGDRIAPGDALATITSAHLGAAKAAYLHALAGVRLWERNHTRETDLLERGVSTEKDLLEAETRLAEARITLSEAEQALLSLGLSKQQIEQASDSGDTSARYVVRASFPGVVVERRAAAGEVVDPSKPLFAIADVSRMWALLDLYESDLRDVQVGQPVVLRVQALPGETFAGHISWVSSQLDAETRTLRARAEFDNGAGLLRAHMFAQAEVLVRDHSEALVVPESSVQWEGCCNVVFVRKSDTLYEPRKVRLGTATGNFYEVLDGVKHGEKVVTQGSFLLKTEIMKGSIGAGCCEVIPGT